MDAEVKGLEAYVTGDRPLYEVVDFGSGFGAAGAHCYRLDLAVALPAPPYGDHALFCFDSASAASVLTEITRPEAVDQTIAREIRTQVGPDDLRIPDDRGAVVGLPGPGG